jgi:glyoxylase-like metal-dependent hydrolase (beta-lactamase superfamily II)
MQVINGIHRIDHVRGANSYMVVSEEGAAVIDTGMPGNETRILEYARGAGVDASQIQRIILTHPDIDHSGSVAKLKGLTNAKVAIHEADAPRLAGERNLKEVKGPMGVLLGIMGAFVHFTPVTPVILLRDSDRIQGLVVIHAPGHTDGSICLYKEGEAMFVGDALKTDSKGRPHLPSGAMTVSMDLAKESIKRISSYRYPVLLPGHGPPMERDASEVMSAFVRAGFASVSP